LPASGSPKPAIWLRHVAKRVNSRSMAAGLPSRGATAWKRASHCPQRAAAAARSETLPWRIVSLADGPGAFSSTSTRHAGKYARGRGIAKSASVPKPARRMASMVGRMCERWSSNTFAMVL